MDEAARILAVDDSLTIRKALEMILVPEGYEVELAASGAEAVTKAREFKPAVILLDFILPDMRGSDVCRALASDPVTSGVPIVLISARGAEIRQAYLDAENVVEYLVKPFTPEEVHAVVNTVLSSVSEPAEAELDTAAPAEQPAWADSAVPADEPPAWAESTIAADEPPPAPEPPAPALQAPAPQAPAAEIATKAPPRAPEAPRAPAAPSWEESANEAEQDFDLEEPIAASEQDAARRELLESMFETLRAGLEGVYVEESDAPAGAGADQARSYTELASLLANQLGETLEHATSGRRFALCGDGSVRSLDDALLDAHRRVCRLLFRAVTAGVIEGQPASPAPPRVLVVSGGAGRPSPALSALSEQAGWHVFHISSDLQQLPIMARCYGPTHLVVDLDIEGVTPQLETLRQLADARRPRVIAVSEDAEAIDSDTLARLGVAAVLADSPSLLAELRRAITGGARPEASPQPTQGRDSYSKEEANLSL